MRTIIVILLALMVVCCTKTIYVPKEVKSIEYRERLNVKIDSVYMRDSIMVRQLGDTVFLEKYQYRYVYRDKLIRDSVFLHDSISYPVYVDVVKKVKYIPTFMWICFGITMAVAGAVVVRVILWVKRVWL